MVQYTCQPQTIPHMNRKAGVENQFIQADVKVPVLSWRNKGSFLEQKSSRTKLNTKTLI